VPFGKYRDGQHGIVGYWKSRAFVLAENSRHFPQVRLDEYVIMPNHLHGILWITDKTVGVQNFEPLRCLPRHRQISSEKHEFQKIIPGSLGSIIRGFKIGVSKWCRQHGHDNFKWQRNYYDRIIRDEDELNRIRQYIINNPLNWVDDRNHPGNERRK